MNWLGFEGETQCQGHGKVRHLSELLRMYPHRCVGIKVSPCCIYCMTQIIMIQYYYCTNCENNIGRLLVAV